MTEGKEEVNRFVIGSYFTSLQFQFRGFASYKLGVFRP